MRIQEIRQEIQNIWDSYLDLKSRAEASGHEVDDPQFVKEANRYLSRLEDKKRQLDLANRDARNRGIMVDGSGNPDDSDFGSFETSERSGGDGWSSFGEFIKATVRAGTPGEKTDHRLYEPRAASGLSESTPQDGGFLIGEETSQQLIDSLYKTGLVFPLCRRVPITVGNSIKIPGIDETSRADGSRQGGIRAYWQEEAALKTKSKPKFMLVQLGLNKLVGLCYLTDELVEDVNLLESYVRTGFNREFSFKLDDSVINGSGVGQPQGILNSNCLISIGKEQGQVAGTIVYENLLKIFARFNGNIQTATFLAHRSTIPQLFSMNLTIGTAGAPVFVPSSVQFKRPATLFGIPVIFVEQCAAVGTKGDLILADLNHYLLAEKGKQGLTPQSAMSIHVRFTYDESVLRFVLRTDGQPEFGSAITPFKGADTESPFIAIETRS